MQEQNQDLLRIFTCGSVDDGKSTLIGHLLYQTNYIYEDQLRALLEKKNSQAQNIEESFDFSMLLDGLEDEINQKITIDVAYRYFTTPKRRFIIADTPGHEQYTRNMATGASTSDLAILLVDARKGLLPQTYRHSYIVSMMGIRHVILVVNKMDLVGYSEEIYRQITNDFMNLAKKLNIHQPTAIPVSALKGDNICHLSTFMLWYKEKSLLDYLESINVAHDKNEKPFRFQVQWINRPSQDFRGISGTVASGTIKTGEEVIVHPSNKKTRIEKIVTFDGNLDKASTGQSITVLLADELDVSRGDLISKTDSIPSISNHIHAKILWMHQEPLYSGRTYIIKIGTKSTIATITKIKNKIDITNFYEQAATQLELNEIGIANITLQQIIALDPYELCRETGGFILIDRVSNETVACGVVLYPLRRSQNIQWQDLTIDKKSRAHQMLQQPFVLWFTGFSGAGKTTLANLLEQKLYSMGKHTYLLDADNIRHHLNKDLGFTAADRIENIRRLGEVARLMVDAGLIVLVASISPYKNDRDNVRQLFEPKEFIEIFVDAPFSVCENRDPKGLYAKARTEQLVNFTGIDSTYEAPVNPEIHLDSQNHNPAACIKIILEYLQKNSLLQ